jgi:hypothetical protein
MDVAVYQHGNMKHQFTAQDKTVSGVCFTTLPVALDHSVEW